MTPHQQGFHREVLHAQAGTTARGGPVVASHRRTAATSTGDAILGVHIHSPEKNGALDAHLHAACD